MRSFQCESGEFTIPNGEDLRAALENLIAQTGDATYWLSDDGDITAGFFWNGTHASVYRYCDGARSFNPNAPDEEMTAFRLENGQLEEFYTSVCIDYESALAAFVEVATTGDLSRNIEWLT